MVRGLLQLASFFVQWHPYKLLSFHLSVPLMAQRKGEEGGGYLRVIGYLQVFLHLLAGVSISTP